MKKALVLLLCFSIILTGCHKGTKQETNTNDITASVDDNTDNNNSTEEDNSGKDTVNKLLSLNAEWSLVQTLDTLEADYEVPAYDAKVPSYSVAADLSNIENIGQFSGFTKQQTKMLSENGFVVLPSYSTRIFYIYDGNEYSGVPNFISSDCALHLYHQFYDKSLMSVEMNYLYDDLELMTKQMLSKSILLLDELKDEELKELQKQNVVYFMVARMLFTGSEVVDVTVDQDVLALAKQEYELCQAAEGYQVSPLFEKNYDYSQFTIRGHYTRSEELGKFFRTMMWFGTAPYAFEEEGQLLYDNIYRALLISFTTFVNSDSTCDAKLWSDIYQPTSQFVGVSDDVNVFDMNGLRLTVYGSNTDPDAFNDDSYQGELEKAVKALPEPQITTSLETLTTPTGKQFRFMGQRYTLDSEILQKLIDNIKRPIPSSLDVMGVLGNKTAENLLFNVYKPQDVWDDYTDEFNKLKDKASALTTDDWKTNLYTGWLWTLQELNDEYDKASGMPYFMTTKAWKYKSLNTALGSYTELKHDSVLYSKQAVAEAGGPDAFADQHYVEPNVGLYYKLLYLTDYTLSILNEKGMLNEYISKGASSYKDLLQLLMDCSVKELNIESLNEDEKKRLLWIGGTMENIILNFGLGTSQDAGSFENDSSDMLVTDISTCKDNYLSLGTGYFDDIYVVVPVDGKLYLTRGTVYSFYEFVSNKRLTDEEWWALNGITTVHSDYGDIIDMGDPSASRPEQPEWISYFKSDSNNVRIEPLEVDWDNLSE